jgi:hypothetical protein
MQQAKETWPANDSDGSDNPDNDESISDKKTAIKTPRATSAKGTDLQNRARIAIVKAVGESHERQ